MLPILQEGLCGLIEGYKGPNPNPYVADQIWKPIQLKTNWIYFHEIFAGQLPGYSDIENRTVDYNEDFINQINR